MKRTTTMMAGCCGLLLCSGAAWADGFAMKPGKWESTSIMTMPMMPEPMTVQDVRCVTEEQAQQDPLAMMLAKGQCQAVHAEEGKGRLEFEVTCQGDAGPPMTGIGHFETQGDRASGSMEMKMAMPAMGGDGPSEMTIHQQWEARRVGPCD
jgi:hypothetical protein